MTPEERKTARTAAAAAKKTPGVAPAPSPSPTPTDSMTPETPAPSQPPAETTVDVQEELGPKGRSSKGGVAHVFENTTDGKQLIRTYSAEAHGKHYADLANQFVEKFKGKNKNYFIEE